MGLMRNPLLSRRPYRYQRLGPVGGYYANGYYQEPVYVRRSLQPWSRG